MMMNKQLTHRYTGNALGNGPATVIRYLPPFRGGRGNGVTLGGLR